MAEEGSVYELEGLEKQLQSLLGRYTSDELRADNKPFCSDFCKLVEEHASRWQVPLPQLRILDVALSYFTRASTFFASNCDHVLHTLSSLALSVFELLLFFDQKDLLQEPLKHFTVTFQECHVALARHQNVHLLQVERLVRSGGPWACPALQAILSESSLPQSEVDGCISSELPVFLELRVRYLLSCERVSEAMALAKCCAWHPTAGQHLFFLQVYLTWLFKTSQHDSLHKEVADFDGKDAIHIICSLEGEEKDDLLLALSRAFLSQQLRKGDMHYLCDLVFVWSKLHHRLKTPKEALLEEIRELMLSATNVNTIFPFIRAILQEVGEDGIQFCVELCVNALESCLPCDVITKSLIYKTIASLLPNDLEVCRACALLVFFLERTVEAYKIVYLLYMHPDQEYHVELSPIRNHVRFETLQVLKKDLYFDPEFWNLIALRTNCVKLMSEKVVSAALEEIMEDKWILNYCTKEPALRSRKSVCQKGRKGALQASAKKRHHKEDTDMASKRFKMGPGKTRLNVDHTVKRKGNHGSQHLKEVSSEPLRRSFWQLERLRDNGYGEHRRTTRLSEKNPPKRRIRKPKWLLEDSGTLEKNNAPQKIKRHGLRLQRHHQLSDEKTSETGQIKNNAKHKLSVNSHLMARENNSKHQKGLSLDSPQPANTPQVILELSLPDNELMGSFIEDTCNRHRGFPQVLLYKPTVKLPATSQPVKTVHRKEVVLRARDSTMFLQQLHCYARRPKGKGNGLNIQGSVSTITRSSVQGSPPKSPHGEISEKPEFPSHTPAAEVTESPVLEKVPTQKAVSRKTSSARELSEKSAVKVNVLVSSQTRATGKVLQTRTRELPKKSEVKLANASQISAATEATESPMLDKALQAETRELCEESAVEMKVTIASQAPTVGKVTQSPGLDKVSKAQSVKEASKTTTSAEVSQTVDNNQMGGTEENASKIGAADPMLPQSQDVVHREGKQLELNSQAEIGYPEVHTTISNSISEVDVLPKRSENDTTPGGTRVTRPREQENINDISALTLVTEMVTELAPEKLAHKQPPSEESASKESRAGSKAKVPHKSHTTSSCSVPYLGGSAVADVQGMTEGFHDFDPEIPENSEAIETEESRLEYCCTFCNKVFKGSRVVAHAMFHYRRDECMFCGTMFKDDLLAMMHLSDHIEKLKRSKELPGNKAQENCASETKDFSTPETSAKDKTTNMSSGRRSRGRPRKSAVSPNSSLPDLTPTGPRKLRSNDKPMDRPSLPEKKQNAPKHLNSQIPVHKVNGHIGKKKEPDRRKKDTNSEAKLAGRQQEITEDGTSDGAENPRLHENRDTEIDSTTSVQVVKDFSCSTSNKMKKTGSLKAIKQNGKEKNGDPQEKVCCPVDGCGWFTDLSKNRVALLYHALNDHYGEVRPLQLAFRIGNNKCSVCMRVLWSFEHFQHHVERHRLSPRHPCLHQGCTARFKTGMEMRRHARRHIPLQAVCCLPGCSKLFICLWALNLHEREHYASKSTKPDKITNKQTGGKHNNTQTVKKQLDHKPTDETATTTVTKAVSFKATHKSRGQDAHKSTGKHDELLSSTITRASLLNQELKGSNETKDSQVLKNLSNKHTSAEPSGPNLRLRQTFKKMKAKNTVLKSHKVLSSSLLRHNIKERHKFKKRQVKVNAQGPKRRGRPPKCKKAVYDENITTGQVSKKTDQKSSTQPAGPSKAAETSNVKEDVKEKEKSQQKSLQVQNVVKTTETSISESKSKKSTSKQIKKDPVKQKGVSHNTSTPGVTVQSSSQSVITTSADKTQKTVDKMKKLHKAKKRSATKEIGKASSDSSKSKKQKVANIKANTKIKKKCPTEQESASKKPAESNSAVPQVEPQTAAAAVGHSADEYGKAKAENTDLTQNSSGNSVPAVQGNSINEITATPTISGEKTHKVTTEEKSKKSDIMKKEGKKEKSTHTASSDSGKTNKRHKDTNKKGDKLVKESRPRKDASKTLKKTAKLKSLDQQVKAKPAAEVESSPDVEGKAKEETLNATLDNSGSSVSVDTTSQPTATEKDTQKAAKKEKSKKPHVPKNSDPNKVNKKRKIVHKEGETKTVKKKCKDQGSPSVPKAAKSKAMVKPAAVPSSVAEEGKVSAETPQSPSNCPGYSMIMNGQASTEDAKSTVCKEALAEYGKKPYMRPPPTAYLDERYTTMPKRRKEMSFLPSSQRSVEQAKVTTALQRQRCANCFATFNSAEDLQSHLQQQKCSNIFGFDSDEEGYTIE